ncbi:MAG TPA: N-acetyl-gamma-glutamyl-phosphate reductase [Oscillospiraceae bacterium]|nr:N-acetyl-gamma-glutamyl-phosphate reductase [Oscillospiraceae bacterium]HPS34492.1 N-acetyl-gamma-glutamyl-phosphate reductase [Oscillospiraceae bacterium]
MRTKIFIDGSAGTTGLRIAERLSKRADLELILLSEAERKDSESRKKALNSADAAFLCLPDAAAIEAVGMIENPDTVVLDTSTAHRTAAGWTYGFPELSEELKNELKVAKRIAVPGCHASGFLALVKPLVDARILSKDVHFSCHSLTGYSGGGKKMIAQYETEDNALLKAPREYGLSQGHKHLPEMKAISGLSNAPAFCPIVSDFYSGMLVTVPLFVSDLQKGATIESIKAFFAKKYSGPVVRYTENSEDGFLSAAGLSGKDSMEVSVFGNGEQVILTARYDNLGKGASGAAIQCLNILLGINETEGLEI